MNTSAGTRVTVYPSIAGGFAAASFWAGHDAFAYMRQVQVEGCACGICECPAASYQMHYPDTVRKGWTPDVRWSAFEIQGK
jgi:hypothetical protein